MEEDIANPWTDEMVVSTINGHSLTLPRWRARFYEDRAEQGWEKVRIDSCAELITEGMTVYDIGAECGDFTALYRKWVGDEGQVIPVEPSPPYWPIIRQIWEVNGFAPPCATFNGFASDACSDAERAFAPGWPEASEGEGIPEFGFRHLAQQGDTTPQITIDDLATLSITTPSAIVMDIEGAEWHALSGALVQLEHNRPLVWVSVHPPTMLDWYGKTFADIVELMASVGYVGRLLGEEVEEFWLFQPEEA